jgi:hypothetical protein
MEDSTAAKYMSMAESAVNQIFQTTPMGEIMDNLTVIIGVALTAMQEKNDVGRKATENLLPVVGIAVMRMLGQDPLADNPEENGASPDIDLSFLDNLPK